MLEQSDISSGADPALSAVASPTDELAAMSGATTNIGSGNIGSENIDSGSTDDDRTATADPGTGTIETGNPASGSTGIRSGVGRGCDTATSVAVTFFGVRGSSPCSGPAHRRIGGNTSCVAIDRPMFDGIDHPTLFFDFGTGARDLAARFMRPDRPFEGVCLLTHAHWDHIQGIPFFPPLLRSERDRVTVVAPRCETGQSLHAVLETVMGPPMFPVTIADLPGQLDWLEATDGSFTIAGVEVLALLVPHTGRTMGYRINVGGLSVTYIPDHQQPSAEPDAFVVDDAVRRLVSDTDLLIFDAQYTREEFDRKSDWGHSTAQYAAWVAQELGAKRLAMFHHDPAHDDDTIDRLVARARCEAPNVEVFAAAQGLTVELSASGLPGHPARPTT